MEKYQLQIPSANSGRAAREAVVVAFEDGADVILEGERESVEIELMAAVTRYTRIRQNGATLVRFSGIVKPDDLPYVAEFNESTGESPVVDMTVRPKQ